MLAGVSHDLRTILTRFKLELALIGDNPEIEAMKKDVDEMARMLEAYLAFRARRFRRAVGADRHGGISRRAQEPTPSATATAPASRSTASRS